MVNVSHGLDDFIRLNFVVNIPNQIVGLSVFHLISLQGKVIKRVLLKQCESKKLFLRTLSKNFYELYKC